MPVLNTLKCSGSCTEEAEMLSHAAEAVVEGRIMTAAIAAGDHDSA